MDTLSKALMRTLMFFVINWGGTFAIVGYCNKTGIGNDWEENMQYAVIIGIMVGTLLIAYFIDSRMNYHQLIWLIFFIIGAVLLTVGFAQEILKINTDSLGDIGNAAIVAAGYGIGVMFYSITTNTDGPKAEAKKAQRSQL